VFCAGESRNGDMTGQYVLILLTVVAGAIAAGVATGCRTFREWSWMAVVGVLIFLGIAALFAVVNPRVPGNIRSLSSAIPRPPGILRARWRGESTPA
jgi:protein-S-isoprenylcysteine O-methyltransferase Ste14